MPSFDMSIVWFAFRTAMKLAAVKLKDCFLDGIITIHSYFSILFHAYRIFPAIRCMLDSIPTKLLVLYIKPLKTNLALCWLYSTLSMWWFNGNRVGNHLVIPPKVMTGTGDGYTFFQRIKPAFLFKICCKG